jgi:arylsulfatase A-like enzyme
VFKGQDYAPDRISAAALEFVREHRDGPFLLYYPTIIPHVALHVPDEELEPYLELGWNDPPFTRQRGGYTPHFTPRAAYAAMITRMDRYVGRVLALLDELGLAENTIVLFSSDNGTSHLKDEVDYDFFDSVGPLRGLKGSIYEGGLRVPLIVRYPGRVEPDSVSDRRVGFEDILPTLLELVGAKDDVPRAVDGISFAPTLLGKPQAPRPFLYREFHGYGGQQAVWLGRFKGVRTGLAQKNKGADPLEIELYDLSEDIGEQDDVADEHPDVIERIERIMDAEREPSDVFRLPILDKRS